MGGQIEKQEMDQDMLVLVNEADEQVGIMEKMEAHEKALLHRAFSVFLFDDAGRMLLQQRSMKKYHSAGLWTNACCSHPYPNEQVMDAAMRRMREELNISAPITKAFDFIYQAPFDNGLTEHEFDHVFIGQYNDAIDFNTEEVMAVKYMDMQDLELALHYEPELYTAWFKIALPMLQQYLRNNTFSPELAPHEG